MDMSSQCSPMERTTFNRLDHTDNRQHRKDLAFRQLTLWKLIGGLFPSARERQLAMEQADLSFPGRVFQVLAFSFDEPDVVKETLQPRDIALLWYGLANISAELLGETCLCEKAAEEGGDLLLLLNSTGKLDRDFITQRLSQTLAYVEKSLSVSYSVGVSDPTESLDDLPRCREQALTAAKYNALFERRSVIFYCDISDREENPSEYPLREAQVLLSAVAQHSRQAILTASAAFRTSVFRCRIDDIRLYLLRLSTALIAQMDKDSRPRSARLCGSTLKSAFRVDTYMEQLTDSILEHLDFLERKRLRQKEDILSNVSTLIRAHFRDPNLSIEELLEQSGYSSGYARRLFQEVYHCTPHDYLLTLRMEEAQRLLRETDKSVKAITAAVGFNNPSYFYAVFKKQVGVSAQDYRARYRNGSTDG